MAAEQKTFHTEVKQLLDLVIHSLYSKKEIFLRELISNASDAIDRLRFEALANKDLLAADSELQITLRADATAKTLTITDNGIGMNRAEVERNIGTIANSGTRAFLDKVRAGQAAGAPELIGQFGVGFYSAFMVATRVTLHTLKAGAGEQAVLWESTGDGTYRLDDGTRTTRGTEITLHLRDDQAEFLDEWKLRKTVKQYSDYIAYPIRMAIKREEVPTDETGKEKEDAEPVSVEKIETLNSMKAIWRRAKSEVKEEEYQEFYKAVSHDFENPLLTIHYAAEGATEFRALLFVPARAPMDLFSGESRHKTVHLYVRNVFISDEVRALLPEYLRFVKGVVDSSDLPLNVSRELLQDDVIIRRMHKSLVGKVLNTLKETLEKQPEQYNKFYREFGKVLKEGMHFDFENREKIQDLLLFESTKTEAGKLITLKEYVGRMAAGQKEIFVLTGESRAALEHSPLLESFRARGMEVLFLTDPIDEWVLQGLTEYDKKPLKSIDRGEVDLDGEGDDADKKKAREEAQAAAKASYEALMKQLQEQLKDHVKEVRLSTRLTDSPCCLVADAHGMNAHMERIMKAMRQEMPTVKRILEINPEHPLLKTMLTLAAKDAQQPRLKDYADLLYDQALLAEGSPLPNASRFTKLVIELMVADGQKLAEVK